MRHTTLTTLVTCTIKYKALFMREKAILFTHKFFVSANIKAVCEINLLSSKSYNSIRRSNGWCHQRGLNVKYQLFWYTDHNERFKLIIILITQVISDLYL